MVAPIDRRCILYIYIYNLCIYRAYIHVTCVPHYMCQCTGRIRVNHTVVEVKNTHVNQNQATVTQRHKDLFYYYYILLLYIQGNLR